MTSPVEMILFLGLLWALPSPLASQNIRTSRMGSSYCTDESSNLWIFGGLDPRGQASNELWKFSLHEQMQDLQHDPEFNEGFYKELDEYDPQNSPSPRFRATMQCTKDAIFLFGGEWVGSFGGSTVLSDSWVYSISKNQWKLSTSKVQE